MDRNWLAALKPNDLVVVSHSVCYKDDYITNVERLTKTLIVLKDGTRFSSENGFEVGANSYDRRFIMPPTDERVNAIKHRILQKKIKNLISDEKLMRKVDVADFELIVSILEKATAD